MVREEVPLLHTTSPSRSVKGRKVAAAFAASFLVIAGAAALVLTAQENPTELAAAPAAPAQPVQYAPQYAQPVQYAQQPVQYAQQPVQYAQQPVQYAQPQQEAPVYYQPEQPQAAAQPQYAQPEYYAPPPAPVAPEVLAAPDVQILAANATSSTNSSSSTHTASSSVQLITNWFDARLADLKTKMDAYLNTMNSTSLVQEKAVIAAAKKNRADSLAAAKKYATDVEAIYKADVTSLNNGFKGVSKDADKEDLERWQRHMQSAAPTNVVALGTTVAVGIVAAALL